MAKSILQTHCLALLTVIVSALAVSPVLADKPSWAGNHSGGHNRNDGRGPDRGDYSGRGQRERDYERHDRNGERQYRGQRDDSYVSRHHDWRDDDRNRSSYAVYSGGRYFSDQHRAIIHDYYYDNYRRGHCPPGLAKKGNGCMPPGQARKWAIGRPLPRNVIFYDVPQPVLMGLGYPPPGYRFVRVASDILLIAVGTGMVMDAIYDLGGGW